MSAAVKTGLCAVPYLIALRTNNPTCLEWFFSQSPPSSELITLMFCNNPPSP